MKEERLEDKTAAEEVSVRDQVMDVLRTCYDPEIPVDVYELGLIYDIQVKENNHVHVLMTVTAPNCPAIETLPAEIKDKIERIHDVSECDIEITFDPPWDKDMMSDVARLQLGFM